MTKKQKEMDIQMYVLFGPELCKKLAEYNKGLIDDIEKGINWDLVLKLKYTEERKKKLKDLETFSKQMKGCRFGFFYGEECILTGTVKGYDWSLGKTSITLHLELDENKDVDVEFCMYADSGLSVDGDTITVTEKEVWMPFTENVPQTRFVVTL